MRPPRAPRRAPTRLALGCAALLAPLTACARSDPGTDAVTTAARPSSSSSTNTTVGERSSRTDRSASTDDVLDHRAPLVGGGELDLATLGRPVLLWFWAPD